MTDLQENAKKQKNEKPRERVNTAVYISSLPHDVDEDELFKSFSRFGVIAEGIDDNKPRIKMYYNEDGEFNGDALIGKERHRLFRIDAHMPSQSISAPSRCS